MDLTDCLDLVGPILRLKTGGKGWRRLRLWEQGSFDELVQRVVGQQVERDRPAQEHGAPDTEERRGDRAKQQAAAGAKSKAV